MIQFFNKAVPDLAIAANRLFAWVSGADMQVMEACAQDGVTAEYAKYNKLGIIMLLLGGLAGVSAGYATWTVSQNLAVSVALGIFWGLMILSVDRLIVATWTVTRSKAVTALTLLARLIMTLLIGYLVSYPVEMAIFQPEIMLMLSREQTEEALKRNAEIENDPAMKTERQSLDEKQNSIKQELDGKQQELQGLYRAFIDESEGRDGTGEIGHGPVAKQKEARYKECKREYQALQIKDEAEIAKIQNHLDKIQAVKEQRLAEMDSKQSLATGLLARASALHHLMAERPVVAWIKWAITLILLLLESLPILTKLSASLSEENTFESKKSEMAYRVMDSHEQTKKYYIQQRDLSDQAHELNAQFQRTQMEQAHQAQIAQAEAEAQAHLRQKEMQLQLELQQMETEKVFAQEQRLGLLREIYAIQKHLIIIILERWKQEQEALIQQNPSQYVQP